VHAARADAVRRNDILDLAAPLSTLVHGRVALGGDAAHAMTPDLGQGGCQALEDAVVLASLLSRPGPGPDPDPGLPGALAAYDAARRTRTTMVAQRSRAAGRLYLAPVRVQELVARAMGRMPDALLVRGLAPIVDWRPPAGS
jgi:2-polyprenyl-6-methoxyphenol hydroxylase-like FAD-dependent oxidoreductase